METCGALTGAIMGIGLVVGREKMDDYPQYQKAMKVADQVYSRFREKIGHSICAEIHKIRYGKVYRLNVPEELKAFHDMGGTAEPAVLKSAESPPGSPPN